jgi:hypothetical protein
MAITWDTAGQGLKSVRERLASAKRSCGTSTRTNSHIGSSLCEVPSQTTNGSISKKKSENIGRFLDGYRQSLYLSLMSTRRILDRAAVLLTEGVEAIDAIEQACSEVACSEGAREAARNTFLTLAAKVERNIAAENRRAEMKVVG